jgi:phytanoyl-CoA hydroxylase
MESIPEKEALRQGFRRDGFVFLPGFLSPEEVGEVNSRLEKLIRDVVPTMPPEHAFYEGERNPSTLKQLQTVVRLRAGFSTR